MTDVLLREIAHCRAGDKGSDSILTVIPYAAGDLSQIHGALTADSVALHFGGMPADEVSVQAFDSLGALVVTLRGRLSGGVTRATGIDPHGKSLSSHLLSLRISWTSS